MLTTLFGGRPFALFLVAVSPLLPRDEMLRTAFHLAHALGAWALAALVVGHAAAALFHQFVLRDDVLARMAPVIGQHVPRRSSQPIPSFRAEADAGNKRHPPAVLPVRRSGARRARRASPRAGCIRHLSIITRGDLPCLFCRDESLPPFRPSLASLPCSASRRRVARPGTMAICVQALRAGGFVIVVRHGATFPDQADTDPLNFDNVAAQRNLNDKGKVLAKAFGAAILQAGVPVGKVFTSKYNRAYETAVIAGFKDIEKTADITEGGLVVSPNENNRRTEAFRKLLGTAPTPGTNTILITHKPNIVDALGKDWFDVREGEASVFRPENDSYRLVARVQMEDWPRIAAAAK